jgi:hypothetical protein
LLNETRTAARLARAAVLVWPHHLVRKAPLFGMLRVVL